MKSEFHDKKLARGICENVGSRSVERIVGFCNSNQGRSYLTGGLVEYLLGNEDKGREIKQVVEWSEGHPDFALNIRNPSKDNEAMYGILEFLSGDSYRARNIKEDIEGNIGTRNDPILLGFNGTLVDSGELSGVKSLDSSTYGILCYLLGEESSAENIKTAIENRIGFKGDFIKSNSFNEDVYKVDNATFAILSHLLGHEDQAREIKRSLEKELTYFGKVTIPEISSNDTYLYGAAGPFMHAALCLSDRLKASVPSRS